jgi:hypothetical protein
MEQTHTWIRKDDYAKLKQVMSATGQTSLCETLHDLINNSKQDQKGLTLLNLREVDFNKLKQIQEDLSYLDLGAVIHHIIESQTSLDIITVPKVLKDDCGVCLTGKSLSGKSYWLANSFIPSIKDHSVLLVDTNNEYSLKEIKSIRELNLGNDKVRFIPSQGSSLLALSQVRGLFMELQMQIDLNKDSLKNLILIIEEAQSYKSSWFNGFLYRSRHVVRKMIVVTPQTDCYQGLETYTIFH